MAVVLERSAVEPADLDQAAALLPGPLFWVATAMTSTGSTWRVWPRKHYEQTIVDQGETAAVARRETPEARAWSSSCASVRFGPST